MKTERTALQELLRKAKKLEAQGRTSEAAVLREESEARINELIQVWF